MVIVLSLIKWPLPGVLCKYHNSLNNTDAREEHLNDWVNESHMLYIYDREICSAYMRLCTLRKRIGLGSEKKKSNNIV
jgi:hypothetical protein